MGAGTAGARQTFHRDYGRRTASRRRRDAGRPRLGPELPPHVPRPGRRDGAATRRTHPRYRLRRRLARPPIGAPRAEPDHRDRPQFIPAKRGGNACRRRGLGRPHRVPARQCRGAALPRRTFGCIFSVTVFEECNAEKAIAEAIRVTKPGGRIAIAVRAIDMPQWWNLDLPEPILKKVVPTPRSVASNGVADASLYRRMRQAGSPTWSHTRR
jgi:SAM-dependent methyltransferase